MKLTSNTLIKNGMPFVDLVLRSAEPFMDEMIITVSRKSTDESLKVVEKFAKDFPEKVFVDFEDVKEPKELTQVRQNQLDKSTGDWILFLDSDDYWPKDRLSYVISCLNNGYDGLSVSPFQVIDKEHYERQWTHMGFTKFFRKQPGVHYEGNFPRDLIYKDEKMLYWKTNERVPMIPCMFYHLSHLKNYSFRNEPWAKNEFEQKVGALLSFDEINKEDVENIFKCIEDYEHTRSNK
jgi:glycosyltransferase involved in cell wall biosynthesis